MAELKIMILKFRKAYDRNTQPDPNDSHQYFNLEEESDRLKEIKNKFETHKAKKPTLNLNVHLNPKSMILKPKIRTLPQHH